MQFQKTELPNGVRVLTEKHLHTPVVCSGVWAHVGSRDEPETEKGLCHLLEHMVFKGTKKRSAQQLIKLLESKGGELNAYTTKEYTCYHAATLKKDTNLSLDVLSDVALNAIFPEKEYKKEKNVVLQEIIMTQEQHEEQIFDSFAEYAFKGNPMGWSILGDSESVETLGLKKLKSFYKNSYKGSNLMVTAVGNVDHDKICKQAEKLVGSVGKKTQSTKRTKPRLKQFHKFEHKDSEQSHILVGFGSPSLKSKMRMEAYVLNTYLGGGMNSKLYQSIREKRGLAYSVYSHLMNSSDSGLNLIYAGTEPGKTQKVLELIYKEVESIYEKGISQKVLDQYKVQCDGFLQIYSDDLDSRMGSIGLNEYTFGKYISVKALLDQINGVTLESLKKYIETYLNPDKFSFLVFGNELSEKQTQKFEGSL